MFFKILDKWFYQLRQVISILVFFLIGFAIFFFVYWILFSLDVQLPDWINAFSWSIINFFAQSYRQTPLYREIIEILPVVTCGVFIVFTYLANCLILFLESNHKLYKTYLDDCKNNLAKTINEELHNDFLSELKRIRYMLVKIRINITEHTSYLTDTLEENINSDTLKNCIQNNILESVNSPFIIKKKLLKNSICFLIKDFENSRDIFSNIVETASAIIKPNITQKISIEFYCCAELYNDISDVSDVSLYLDKVLDLKIANRILVTPKFKLYFDNIFPNEYTFELMGEYNLSTKPDALKNVMVYALRRKN